MSEYLPKLRSDLDVMPSPLPSQPGLLLRDQYRYTEDVVIVPPAWIALLRCLDGDHTALDAQAVLTRLAGGHLVSREEVTGFVSALEESGFLDTERFEALKSERRDAFRQTAFREPSHAGSAYPESAEELEARFASRLDGRTANGTVPLALAAPHVSPEGGFPSYGAAYDIDVGRDDVTFVILGTSHYGEPERFGITRKPFRTPLGVVEVDEACVSFLAERAGPSLIEDDYCHLPEHSIELQVVLLQYRVRRPFRIVPILVGPFADSLQAGRAPEHLDSNRRFFDALSALASERNDLVWILGVDMAHIGPRYGHSQQVRANEGFMLEVREADERRIERICAGDADGFFELVHPEGDPLNWCGYAPIYTFLRSVAPVEGRLRHYEQWNIDDASVVSFAALHFDEPSIRSRKSRSATARRTRSRKAPTTPSCLSASPALSPTARESSGRSGGSRAP